MKKPEIYLKEYCAKLSDDNVKFLQARLSQRISSDLSEATEFLGSFREIDKWLCSAADVNQFYDMIDTVQYAVQREHERRLAGSAA